MPEYGVFLPRKYIEAESAEEAVAKFVDILKTSAGNFKYLVKLADYEHMYDNYQEVDASLLMD